MRKLLAAILCLMVVLFLVSCGNSAADPTADTVPEIDIIPVLDSTSGVFTFPEGCVVGGIDLKDMVGVNAYTAIKDAAQNYVLKLEINGKSMTLTAEDFELAYSSTLMQDYVNALKEGNDPRSIFPFTYNKGLLRHLIAAELFELPENPSLVYDAGSKSFTFTEYTPGTGYDLDSVMEALDSVVLTLNPECSLTVATTELAPAINANSESGKQLLEKANNLLATELIYSDNPKNPNAMAAKLDADVISSFLSFDESYSPVIDSEAVHAYAEKISEGYTVGDNDGLFLNSLGEYVEMRITYRKEVVKTEELAEDILYCFNNGITGVRQMPYKRVESRGYAHDLNGTYVEINLTEQRLWVYKDFECKLYTPIVTGNLSEEWNTPTGVYSVYQRIYPTRARRVFRYWMPFLGAYGLHDANWRSEFRSDEYLFEGSHGCVNIPPENFKLVYKYVDIGTPVVIYGGADKGAPVTQVISGPSEINVGVDAKKFTLDVTPKYGERKQFTYSSDNENIVTVSKQGIVTVKGTGTAKITVKSKNWSFCPSVKKVITVNVHEDCSKVGHMIVEWKQTKAPTCKSTGTEKGVCTSCNYSETRTIDIKHDFYFAAYMHDQSWVVTKWPTCSEAGEKYRSCSDCGYTETVAIPATDHVPVCWHVEKPATATEAGKLAATCHYCGTEATKEIPAGTNTK